MKLCIIKADGMSEEVLMSERIPSLAMLNNELLFLENYQYKIIIRDNEGNENIELFVGDYSVTLHYNSSSDCYESEFDLIFNGCFDVANFMLYVDGDGEEKILYTDYFRIATTKQTAKQVEEMLYEIEENLPNFLDVCFSRNMKKSGLVRNNMRSIWNTLKLVDDIIEVYEENYSYFLNHKKTSVERVASIVDVKAMRTINQESLRWIVCNPDILIPADYDSGITINGKNYIPSKVKTYLSQYSYEIYENKVVLGFLQTILDYLENQIVGFSKEIIELENIPEVIVAQLPNTHELTGRCVYIYYKGIIKCFEGKKSILQEVFYKYERALECSGEVLYGMPKLTNTFKQVYHYRMCYECMVRWFEAGDYTFDHLNYLFKLKTLSRIFEYFCLIKLQKAIVQSGYELQKAERVVYDLEDGAEDINNQYVFGGNGYEITLLYEPSIFVNKVIDGVNLYSTGYNFVKSRWNDKWTPDFIIRISTNRGEYYYILDAKYSNALNVKKRYIPELVLKYSSQIASKDKFFSDIIGIGAIYPGNADKIYFFKKNAVNSKKQSLPLFFSLTILGGDEGDLVLKNRLDELLKIVEEYEIGGRDAHILNSELESRKETMSELVRENSLQSMYEIVDDSKKISGNDEVVTSVQMTNVNGKKCFYYAKSMCLCQKTRCNIVDAPCQHFVSRNSKKLLKEEDSCRNFIRYTRRGKLQRVECSISGMPGCVGPDACKFCLKKNRKKLNTI